MHFLMQVKGFTPVIDALAQETGLSVASVYGAVWRFCQMDDQVCYASVEKIAKRACVSDRTAIRNLKTLVKLGYLIDTTPDLRNKPHTYKDAGKAKIIGLMEARTSPDPEPAKGLTPCQCGSDTLSDPGLTPCQLKIVPKESIQDSKEGAADAAVPAPGTVAVAIPVKEKAKPKVKKTKTPTPAAILVFRENAHRFPAKVWWDDVTEAVGTDKADLERWGETVKGWVGTYPNPMNVKGMLDFFRRREIPGTNGGRKNGNRQRNSSPPQPPTVFATGPGHLIAEDFPDER